MKKLLILPLLAILFACGSNDDNSNEISNDKGTLFFTSYEKYNLSTGEEKERKIKVAAIMIWNADGKEFDFEKSSSDILEGYVWDNNTNKSYKYNYGAVYTDSYDVKLKPGKYAIFVMYDNDKQYTRSYSYFEIEANKLTDLKKYYKPKETGNLYAPW